MGRAVVPVRRAFRFLLLLPLLLAAAVMALPSLLPVEAWKPSLQARVKEATGRDLRIDGSMRVSLLPRLEIEAADVGLSNVPGAEAREMVTLKELHLELQVLPLLSGRIVVDRFVLVGPVVSLETAADGKSNWQLEGTAPSAPESPSAAAPQASPSSPLELRLEDVRLEDGTVRYVDRRKGGGTTELSSVAVGIAMTTLDDPFHIQGSFSWKQRPVTVDATVADPRALMSGRESAVRARIETGGGHVGCDGAVEAGRELRASGTVDLDVPSIRDLSAWLGQPIDAPKGTFGRLKINGRAALEPGSVSFTGASVALDALQTSGAVAVAWNGPRPRITADLAVQTLDLRPLLPDTSAAPPAGNPGALKTGPGGWSEEPFSPGLLRSVDASLKFSVDALLTPHLRTGKGSLTATLDNGRLDVAIGHLELYGGSGKGAVSLRATGADSVALESDLHLVDVQLEPLLRDTFGGNWLAGRSRMDLTLAGGGHNQQELIGSLAGKGAVDVQDGSIRGINLAAMLINVASAFQKKGDSERTEFRQVRGTFRMNGGVLQNSDLELQSDLLQAEGQGTVDFGRCRVDYRVSPKFVAPVVGQLTGGIVGMKVPVLVRGPWSDVSFAPDLVGLLKEGVQAPGALLKGAADFTKGLFGR